MCEANDEARMTKEIRRPLDMILPRDPGGASGVRGYSAAFLRKGVLLPAAMPIAQPRAAEYARRQNNTRDRHLGVSPNASRLPLCRNQCGLILLEQPNRRILSCAQTRITKSESFDL